MNEPLIEFVSGTHELIHHVKRLWPDQAKRLLNGPAYEVVAFLTTQTGVVVAGTAPLSFTYWLPTLRTMEP